jgi:hypothetical protein
LGRRDERPSTASVARAAAAFAPAFAARLKAELAGHLPAGTEATVADDAALAALEWRALEGLAAESVAVP